MDFRFRTIPACFFVMMLLYTAHSKESKTPFDNWSTIDQRFIILSVPQDLLLEFVSGLKKSLVIVSVPQDLLLEFVSGLKKSLVIVSEPKDSLLEFVSGLEKSFVIVSELQDSLLEFVSGFKKSFVSVPKDSLLEFVSGLEEPFVIVSGPNDSPSEDFFVFGTIFITNFETEHKLSTHWTKVFIYIVVMVLGTIMLLGSYSCRVRLNKQKNIMYYKSKSTLLSAKPAYQTDGAGGFDLRCMHEFSVECNSVVFVDTGLSFEIPKGTAGFVKGRSSMAKRGLWCYEGLIDSDFRGNVSVLLYNLSNQRITIAARSRIAQMVIMKVERPSIVETCLLNNTKRGDGAFGSTGDGTND